jgi:hypothetical protein
MADEHEPEPFLYQPDPAREYYVQAKGERLERRGPRRFFIVGKTHDGRAAESQLAGGVTFEMRGS